MRTLQTSILARISHQLAFALAIVMAVPIFGIAAAHNEENKKTDPVADFIDAARWGRTEEMSLALKNGMDVNAPDENGVTAIRWAAVEGQEAVILLLIKAGADVNATDNQGGTGLMMAARWGFKDVVVALLDAGADVNALSSMGQGRTALMYAAIAGHDDIVELLLEAKADTSIKDGHGNTASDLAKRWGYTETAKLLEVAAQQQFSTALTS